jgi:arsenite methyltransferase
METVMGEELKGQIREHYAAAARAAERAAAAGEGVAADEAAAAPAAGAAAGACCGPAVEPAGRCGPAVVSAGCCGPAADQSCAGPAADAALLDDPGLWYGEQELDDVPLAARLASLGCGNPVALAELHPGETVLDLGSGGGIDVLLSARRVGPTGKAYGLDMTDDMLALAEENRRKAGAQNVEFLKGDMEAVPLPDESVDVIISNCVVNLAPDKDRVLGEAWRVLRPGGRFAVSDIVFEGDVEAVPEELRRRVEAWAACIAGAMGDREYRERLESAGFADVELEVTHVYDPTAEGGVCGCEGIELPAGVRLVSAFVRARKPS